MASGGGKNKKGVIYCCSCSEELEEDDQVLAIKCSAGHYIYARNPKVADRSKVLVYVFCSKRIDFRAILRNTLGTLVDWGLSPKDEKILLSHKDELLEKTSSFLSHVGI